jgi:hypothetical protein
LKHRFILRASSQYEGLFVFGTTGSCWSQCQCCSSRRRGRLRTLRKTNCRRIKLHMLTERTQCQALADAGLEDRLIVPSDSDYEDRVDVHWSLAARLTPKCFVQPHNAGEVAKIVTTLVEANKTSPCQFAVRSGGHQTWAGAANIEDGVTVDLGFMNSTTYVSPIISCLPGAGRGHDSAVARSFACDPRHRLCTAWPRCSPARILAFLRSTCYLILDVTLTISERRQQYCLGPARLTMEGCLRDSRCTRCSCTWWTCIYCGCCGPCPWRRQLLLRRP